jgi:release factor glutamine methyltransferase
MPIIKNILLEIQQKLSKNSSSPYMDGEILLAYLLNKPTSWLVAHELDNLDTKIHQKLQKLVLKRENGIPIAYIINSCGFWNMDLYVDENVLIPRADTEILVDHILKNTSDKNTILDLGCGSGAIGLAIAIERPSWKVIAIDKSLGAINITKQNTEKYKLKNHHTYQSDWFGNIEKIMQANDISGFNTIVSNPPYISTNDSHLEALYDPISALVANNDGMEDIEIICQQAQKYLLPNKESSLIIEHGYNQKEKVKNTMQQNKFIATSFKDISGNDRMCVGKFLAT